MLSVFALVTSSLQAAELQAKLIQLYQTKDGKDGKPKITTVAAGLVNMDQVMDEPGANCGQFVGPISVEGVQFSQSGATLESFRFTAADGAQWSVPTNIGKLSNAERSIANSFIRVGKKYFVHVQSCGSGGFASLINMYDLTVRFKP